MAIKNYKKLAKQYLKEEPRCLLVELGIKNFAVWLQIQETKKEIKRIKNEIKKAKND